ncbi:unnamed protein product [Effrenium voratum]|nr:unnamed protein product [Effrenium voratum]
MPTVKMQPCLASKQSFKPDQACVYATLWSQAPSAGFFSQANSQATQHFDSGASTGHKPEAAAPLSLRISDTARAAGAVIGRMSNPLAFNGCNPTLLSTFCGSSARPERYV